MLRGFVAWCENKRIDQVLGKWSAGVDVNGFNQVDVWLVFEPPLTEWVLLAGAGFAQSRAGTVPDGYWQRRLSEIGDADFLAAFDDPRDQEAIKIGFYLWENCGTNVTNSDIGDAVRGATNLLITKPCDKLWSPEQSHCVSVYSYCVFFCQDAVLLRQMRC